ncbi:MAG: VWA domain-containing protein [Desulfobacteraceae bacterium]|nr:VWA domain-containing protein [Desulfobacteraceae bacterium]
MISHKKRLLNTLNHSLFTAIFMLCLVFVAGTIGCSDSGGKSKTGYHLSGYDGVVSEQAASQQSLVSAIGNTGLDFYAEFPWFVNMTYQVSDKDEWGTADLTVDDFSVLEDGIEVSKLASEMNIRKRDALPSAYSYGIKTVLFLDNTPSSSVNLEKMLEAGQVIVDNIDEKQQQEIVIAAYDETGEVEVDQDFTDSATDLTEALSPVDGIQPSYGTTNFYSGVISALALWDDNHSPENVEFQQGFLVVVTDGKDTTSLSNVDDAITARGDKQVIVVAVGNEIPESILKDLELLGNGGFYHVTDPLIEPDENVDNKENLCENMLEVQKRMMAYADSFYWLRYKTSITSESSNSNHTAKLSVVDNGNSDEDSEIAGTFNSDVLFSGEPSIYFNTSASDPNGLLDEETGITEKVIVIERGQGAGEVVETIQAVTYIESGSSPSQYKWTSDDNSIVTVKADSTDSFKANVTVVGPGDAVLTVTDTVNNVTQTMSFKVKVREESFEMIKHIVTSQAPWFADATFQVRRTYDPDDYDEDNPWRNQWEWLTDLAREDMTVMESGQQVDMEDQELHLRKRDNIPSNYTYTLKTVLLIDNSPSARAQDNLNLIKQAAKAFVKRAMINDTADNTDFGPILDSNDETPQQEFAVVSYDEDGETILVQDFSSDLDTVNDAIDGIVVGFSPIDFYGGMLEALNLWDDDNSPYDAGNDFVQGVVIVLSDGWQSNPGFYERQAVLDETGTKQIICVGVGDDLVSEGNEDDLVAFGNAGFYSVPDPGQTIEVAVFPDSGTKSRDVTYTALQKTLMNVQDVVYAYANSFYWLDYKSKLAPAPDCDRSESIIITINNNSNNAAGKNVTGKFESCNYFEGIDGMIYVNSTVTNPDGITGDIDLQYVMLGNIPLADPIYPLEAFTYNHENTPAYEWLVSNSNIVNITVDPRSYANSRATLNLPAVKQNGSSTLNVTDNGNGGVFRRFNVNVDGIQLPAPVAYYPFDGNADDKSGNGYDGDVNGATLTIDRHGNPNSTYFFNGTSDYIAIRDLHYGNGGLPIGDITVCAWIKLSSFDSLNRRIISFDASDYWALITANGNIALSISTAEDNFTISKPVNDNAWHLVSAVYDNSQMRSELYIDGQSVGDVGLNSPFGTDMIRYGFVGAGSEAEEFDGVRNVGTYFYGSIDDVIIFNDLLTSTQIQNLWNSTK